MSILYVLVCTLVLAWHVFDSAPVAVAANRDESFDRPATPPELYESNPTVLAPRDVRAGGTWIGVNEYGLFAGITNRWSEGQVTGDRSRGLLVGDVLSCESTEEAIDLVERSIETHEYEDFILVVATPELAVALEWDGSLEVRNFEPGVHVVVNVGIDDDVFVPPARPEAGRKQARNARRLRRELADVHEYEPAEWLDRAARLLSDHDYGVCVHGDGFGTRSSSILSIGEEMRYAFADGPPCRNTYTNIDVERHI